MTGEQKKADQAGNNSPQGYTDLNKAERDRLNDFARTVDGWLWEMDENFRFTYMSDNVEEMTGLAAAWHYGKTRDELGTPDIPDEDWQAHIDTMKRHEPFRKFVYSRKGPEETVWLRSDGFPLFDESGRFTGYRGIGRFVTPEVEAHNKAERSQFLLAAAIDGMSETFVLWDEDDRLVICNNEFRTLNNSISEMCLPGVLCEDFFRAGLRAGLMPSAAGREEDWLRERMEFHSNPDDSLEIQRHEGRWLLVREHIIPEVGTATMSTDITLQKEAEFAVQKSEQRFRDIADVSSDWYWETDVNDRYTYFSAASQEEHNGSQNELPGVERSAIVSEEFKKTLEWQSHLQSLAQHLPFNNIEHPYTREDGSTGWSRISGKPVFDSEGKFSGYRGATTEVSELHRIVEEMVAARERAEAANKAKSEFLSSISHELRTPMNSILGFSQLIANDPDQPLSEDQADSLGQILSSGQHLLVLINDLLDLAQIESGQMVIQAETVFLERVLDNCLEGTSTLADSRNITVHCEAPNEILLRADETRLRQVLLNLLSNAIKYNRPSGKVTIKTEMYSGNCRISVTDTGVGFDNADREKLFEPFNRLGWENSETEGTGIGLAICKRLIIAMNGNIGCTSVQGEGATFWIDVPIDRHRIIRAVKKQTVAEIKVDADRQQASNRISKILYVEDNKANVDLMRQVIKRQKNVELLVAGTAEVGLIIAGEQQPDIIVLDINLPGMDGFDALEKLKNNPRSRDIPVIALSADAMPDQVEKGRRAGFVAYLTKPLDITAFQDITKDILEKKAARSDLSDGENSS